MAAAGVERSVTLYADSDGELSFYPSPGATAVPFELAEGYRVGEGLGQQLCVFGRPGTLGLSLKEALDARVLRPVFDEPIVSTADVCDHCLHPRSSHGPVDLSGPGGIHLSMACTEICNCMGFEAKCDCPPDIHPDYAPAPRRT